MHHFPKLLNVQDPVLIEVSSTEHLFDLDLADKLWQPLHGGPELVEADRLLAEVPLVPRDPPTLEGPEGGLDQQLITLSAELLPHDEAEILEAHKTFKIILAAELNNLSTFDHSLSFKI